MIRTLRALFLGRLLREKLLLLIFLFIGLLWWLSAFSQRARVFWQQQHATTVELQDQKRWLDNRTKIEAEAQRAAAQLDASKTLDSTRLVNAINQAAYEAGLRNNVAVGIGYIEAWLRGQGCVPLFNLMEDAATAEISRTQVWQWLHTGTALDDGRVVTLDLVDQVIAEELSAWKARVGADAYAKGRYADAASLFRDLVAREDFTEFLTLPAYERVVAEGA